MRTPPLMKFDPVTGNSNPFPSEARQYRAYHGQVAWLINPYTGDLRDARDIGTDTFGRALTLTLTDGEGE
jgi:hypothetical protein